MSNEFSDIELVHIGYARNYVLAMIQAARDYHTLKDKLASIEYAAQPSAIRYDRENVSTSAYADTIPDAVIRSIERKGDIEAAIRQLEEEYSEFCDKLLQLESVGGVYLFDYHTRRFSHWSDIWAHYHIDRKTGVRRRREALLELYEKGLVPQQYMMPTHQAI